MADHKTRVSHYADCGRCTAGQCPTIGATDHEPAWEGGRLALAAIMVFLVPLVLAIVGAACGQAYPHGQLAGAVVGLIAGMVLALGGLRAHGEGAS